MSDGTFLISIAGQIEYLDVMSAAGSAYHCKYEFHAGPDWTIVGGLETGLSQIANVVNNNDKVVFNFPVDLQFKSTNPFGWPQMVISVYKEMRLEGYGRTHMPIKPGNHHLEVNLARPKASSLLGYLGTFFGYQPQLLQPKLLASTAGSNLIRMETSGKAHMTFNIVSQGFLRLGYDYGRSARE
ncbi:B9 domain-containing protein 1 [Dendroctonus ponderosae]|uniref:B9 domain-containing protein 1 n=1 Tax=Dendroctonus ponderosae TaxID=77166 RepID=U4U365_DENPD|nr:B9 domain-containing protein 1 [Dendroctonus ponderosae]ERL84415.1 hypothetical protein D910_01848 [Dendroctonus ponderosae]KAH1026238.1 hypothetical protein HUJ05_010786 [Dendroctonus ponderosae]